MTRLQAILCREQRAHLGDQLVLGIVIAFLALATHYA